VRTLTTTAWARAALDDHVTGVAEGFPCDGNRVGTSLASDGGSRVFSQPVFAQGTFFVAAQTQGLYNFAP